MSGSRVLDFERRSRADRRAPPPGGRRAGTDRRVNDPASVMLFHPDRRGGTERRVGGDRRGGRDRRGA
ncbi:MAG: hypothetical protein ACREL9_09475 [Gemmatimonadales bacterium]